MRQHQQLSEHNSSTLASSGPSSHDSSRRATMGGRSSRNSGSGGSNKLPALDLNSSTQQGTAGGSSSRAESARSKCSNADERTTGTTDSSNYTEHRWSGSDRLDIIICSYVGKRKQQYCYETMNNSAKFHST